MIHIISTSTTEHLVKNLRKKNLKVILPEKNKEGKRCFPDEEIYIRILEIDKLKKGRVIVLHSGSPKPNQGLVELELILQFLKENNICPEVFFTYFPYGMQDRVFQKGEINTAENLIKKLTEYYKIKRIYIIDPHFGKRQWVKKYPIKSITAVPLLMEKVRKDFKNILFLSPDKGGRRRTGIPGIKKKRLNSFKVKYLSPKISLKGKTIGVVDDIIETGGTLLRFHETIRKSGAKKIIVLVSQGILRSGITKVKSKYSKLYLTNAVDQKEANVDVTDLILKAIS